MENPVETIYDPKQRIWSGLKKKDIFGSDITLGEVALYLLNRVPDKIIQIMDTTGEELTAAQLIRDSKIMAIIIHKKLGLQIGDVVGINATNTTNLTAVLLGAYLCGTPTHSVYPGFDKETLKLIYKVSEPKVIFCDVETYETTKIAIDELKLNVKFFTLNGNINGVTNVKELLVHSDDSDFENFVFPCKKMSGDDTAVILCSSGTTGTPKGVLCSHKMLLNRPLFENLPKNATLFTFSTMYWASGLLILVSSLLNVAKRVITDKPYTPEYYIDIVTQRNITHLINTPQQLAHLLKIPQNNLKKHFAHVQSILCGGSKVPKIISEQMNALLPTKSIKHQGIIVSYGMSEVMIVSRNEVHHRRDGTEGKLEPNTAVRIVDKDGQFLGPNQEGILHVRIPYKWGGYYRNTEATQNCYINGWVITGDIGYFDDDGYLTICTRNNDVFKSNNFQIYPELIEDVIMQLPGVQEVCVFGVPDIMAGNLTACAIVRAHNEDGNSLCVEHIIDHIKINMATVYHINGGIYFLDDLPKTGSGKIQRRKVIEILKPLHQNKSI